MTKLLLSVVVVKYKSKLPKLANLIAVDNNRINLGFSKAANVGVKKALRRGANRILLLNPDVAITQKQIETLNSSPADVVSPVLKFKRQGKWVYDFGGKINWFLGRTTHLETTDHRPPTTDHSLDYVSGACMMVKREVFEKIGYFDEQFFMYFEDVDFCLRANKAGFSVAVANGLIVSHKIVEHRFGQNFFKIRQVLKSNFLFIAKWLFWFNKPVAFVYLLALAGKIAWQKVTAEPILEPFLRIIRFEKVLKHVRPNTVVVDIGCGHTPHLLNRLERYISSGIGFDQLTINARMGKIRLISQTLSEKVPLASGFADHVTLVAVLEHLDHPEPLLRESYRILKRGGSLILTTPTPLNKPLLEFLSFQLGVVSCREIAEHRSYFWKGDLIKMVRNAGFKNIHHEYFEFWLNSFLIARK